MPKSENDVLFRLEKAVSLMALSELPLKAIRKAVRHKELPKAPVVQLIDAAVQKRIISEQDALLLRDAEAARIDSMKVDEFGLEEYRNLGGSVAQAKAQIEPASGIGYSVGNVG